MADELLETGFPGERLAVLPRPLVAQLRRRPPLGRLLVTDAGSFPRARRHGRIRPQGAPEVVVIVVEAGAGWCSTAGTRGRLRVTDGHALLLPADVPHAYGADEEDPWTITWMHVTGDDAADLVAASGASARDPLVPLGDVFTATALARSVVDHLLRDETRASLLAASGAAWHLLATVAATRSRGDRGGADVHRVQEFLREQMAEPVRVPELAAMAHLSTSHFSALFRRTTGYSVMDFVKRLRMARARTLLATTEAPVAGIARAVGYPDPYYFARQFRRVVGTSPTAYRRAEREGVGHPPLPPPDGRGQGVTHEGPGAVTSAPGPSGVPGVSSAARAPTCSRRPGGASRC